MYNNKFDYFTFSHALMHEYCIQLEKVVSLQNEQLTHKLSFLTCIPVTTLLVYLGQFIQMISKQKYL